MSGPFLSLNAVRVLGPFESPPGAASRARADQQRDMYRHTPRRLGTSSSLAGSDSRQPQAEIPSRARPGPGEQMTLESGSANFFLYFIKTGTAIRADTRVDTNSAIRSACITRRIGSPEKQSRASRRRASSRIAVTPNNGESTIQKTTVPPPVSEPPTLLHRGHSSEPEEVMYIIGCHSEPPHDMPRPTIERMEGPGPTRH